MSIAKYSCQETPLINTITEAAELVGAIDHPHLRTMIDCSAAGLTETCSVPALIERWLQATLAAESMRTIP